MTSGFYEQLGVEPEASAGQLRAAYGRVVAKLVRRRKQIVEQGGDPAQVDEMRAQVDEAWGVLSDPVRRRRYDAMSTWTAGNASRDAETLWAEVGDALVHPAAALAAKLLRVTTHLQQIGQVPIAPSSSEDEPPTLVPHDEDLTAPRIAARRLAEDEPTVTAARPAALRSVGANPALDRLGAPVVQLPRSPSGSPAPSPLAAVRPGGPGAPISITPDPSLRVVDGTPSAPPVLVMPTDRRSNVGSGPRHADAPATLGPEDLAALVDAHGYSGEMLRAVRERRGLPLQEVADTTRISVRYLEAIEADRFADLPSATFVRGYVREVARVLGLDTESVVAGYMRRFGG